MPEHYTEKRSSSDFPVAYITCVSETESLTIFSLSENFDSKRFVQRFLNAEKINVKKTL